MSPPSQVAIRLPKSWYVSSRSKSEGRARLHERSGTLVRPEVVAKPPVGTVPHGPSRGTPVRPLWTSGLDVGHPPPADLDVARERTSVLVKRKHLMTGGSRLSCGRSCGLDRSARSPERASARVGTQELLFFQPQFSAAGLLHVLVSGRDLERFYRVHSRGRRTSVEPRVTSETTKTRQDLFVSNGQSLYGSSPN